MSRSDRIRIALAESQPVVATGLSHCLSRLPGIQIQVLEMHTREDLESCVAGGQADIVIANPAFCVAFDPAALRRLNPAARICAIEISPLGSNARALYDEVFSIADDMTALAGRIRGLIHTSSDAVGERESLSQREKEIIALVVKGLTNKEIAEKLYLSVHTVITHRRNIARKLEIHSATGLTIYAIVNRLVDLSDIRI